MVRCGHDCDEGVGGEQPKLINYIDVAKKAFVDLISFFKILFMF